MALVYQKLTLEVTPGMIPPVLHVTEYDVNMQIDVTFTQRGQPFEIPSSTTAKVEGTLAGHPFRENCTVNGNTVTFILSENMTAYAGRAWTKIVLTKDSWPVSTCGFWLDCDRAGVEAGDVLRDSGFQEQINEGIAEYFDGDPPFFELPSGGQSGQALLSDGANGAYWGQAQGGGTGLTDEAKTALMNVASHIGAWTDGNAQTYVQALYDALYPPANLSFITAVFSPGQNVIYTTDTLDTLKQYLTVTAHYSDSSTQIVNSYTLSGTLRAGQSTITVLYGGKSTTFTVTVVDRDAIPSEYQKVEYIEATGTQYLNVGAIDTDTNLLKIETAIAWTDLADIQLMLGDGGWYFGLESGSYRIAMNKNLVAPQQNVFQDVSIEMTRYTPSASASYSIGGTTGNVSVSYSLVGDIKLNLFGLGGNSLVRPCKCRMKSTKLTVTDRSSVTTTYNLIPCYRKADGEIGMYDAESGTFLTNAGTGAFLKGGNI